MISDGSSPNSEPSPDDPDAPIRFRHRRTGTVETEVVYGESSLRWIYGRPLGRLTLALAVRRILFSRLYGWLMNRPSSRRKIDPFIFRYGIDTEEMRDPPSSFPHFNAFFYRALKPDARPLPQNNALAVFPADGRHLVFPDLSRVEGVFVKGQNFSLPDLLASNSEAEDYRQGSLILSRLCPVDYHRFHFPFAARVGAPRHLPGFLYSVSPFALRRRLDFLHLNKRVIIPLHSPQFGTVLMIPVGATCVGGIHFSFSPGEEVTRGQEAGYFSFGGSSVILLFPPQRIRFDQDLVEASAGGLETYARMGERLGEPLG